MIIKHDSRVREYRKPFGAVETGTEVYIAIEIENQEVQGDSPLVLFDTDVQGVRLMVWKDEDLLPVYYPMDLDPECIYLSGEKTENLRYDVSFTVPDEGCLLWYAFEITYTQQNVVESVLTELLYEEEAVSLETVYYGNNRQKHGGLGTTYDSSPECFQITVYKPAAVPEWYKNSIVYQIFPDRFCRDDDWRWRTEAANDRVNKRRRDIRRTICEDWYRPAYYGKDAAGRVTEWPFYGGSLKGIESKLDYLKSLGVTCIYLNPIFEAVSNHRYDTADYMHIDPALGSDDDFRSLADAARKKGIRIMLDGVFSHTGVDSIYFRNNKDWYFWDKNEPTGYKCWWGVADLPDVDENNPEYREFITGENGVVAHWLDMGASAWRLDVADELPDSFIEAVRSRVKASGEDNVLIGEVWEDASNKISYGVPRRYLLGDELDGTMNYPMRDILLDYVNYTISSREAGERFLSLEENYPKENFYGALNLIGSHDRERILTMMAADSDRRAAVKKVKLLAALSYALPGVPCIYYGDEAGLTGHADPQNRGGFPWGREDPDISYHYRMLGLIYDQHPALADGDFEMLSCRSGGASWKNSDVLAFTRSGRDVIGTEETILVLANRSYGSTDVDLSGIKCSYAFDLLGSEVMPVGTDGSLGSVHMKRLSVKIISLRDKAPQREDFGKKAGVIAHVSSIPGGRLGKPARDFVDYIASAGFRVWQVLPLNPAGTGGSPYSSYSAFAGEPAFINEDELPSEDGYMDFIRANKFWLYDYITYVVIRESMDGKQWTEWPDMLRNANAMQLMRTFTAEQKARANTLCREQYYFSCQWADLKRYANSVGVSIMGDLPIYMSVDSADVWANRDVFLMDENGRLSVHAGVPPDAFSSDGQDWGNPLYNWEALEENGYDWWMKRMRQCAERYDMLRVDHFRGLSEYYAIPEGSDPFEGRWQHGPGLKIIAAIRKMIRDEGLELKFLAEDLGHLDAGVMDLLELSGFPGMDIWQFSAWEMMEMSEKHPEKAAKRAFYTGTHDNDTLVGFLTKQVGSRENNIVGVEVVAFDSIKKLYESNACLVMLQLQDVFMLGSEARMNVPGVPEGNWKWHIEAGSIEQAFPNAGQRASWLRSLASQTGRR